MAVTFPPSLASAASTAGSLLGAAAPAAGAGVLTAVVFKFMDRKPKPTAWEQVSSKVQDANNIMGLVKTFLELIGSVRNVQKDRTAISTEEFDKLVETRAEELRAQREEFETRVAAAIATEKERMGKDVEERVAEAVAAAVAAKEVRDEADDAQVTAATMAAKITRKPKIQKAASAR
jgi:hypothetical protein